MSGYAGIDELGKNIPTMYVGVNNAARLSNVLILVLMESQDYGIKITLNLVASRLDLL